MKIVSLFNSEKILIYLLVIYIVGLVGLLTEATVLFFTFLVPINIFFVTILALIYHKNWSFRFISSLILIFCCGFLLELLGVNTGVVFGKYKYENGLGIQFFGVPIIMGVNWFLIVYSVSIISSKFIENKLLISIFGASLMLLYDVFLEPSAIKYHFWVWDNLYVPVQNYIAWWVSAFIFILFFISYNKKKYKNSIAEGIFWLQLGFFICLLIFNNLTI